MSAADESPTSFTSSSIEQPAPQTESANTSVTPSASASSSSDKQHEHEASYSHNLLTKEQLKERYEKKFDLYKAYKGFSEDVFNFLIYIVGRFNLYKRKQRKREAVQDIIDFISEHRSDYEIYLYLRDLQVKEQKIESVATSTTTTNSSDIANLKEYEAKKYKGANDSKIVTLKDVLSYEGLGIDENLTYLDIGTEKVEFLDQVDEILQLANLGGKSYGINIDSGFCHYDEKEFKQNQSDNRFQLYDGKTIPFKDDQFDLITLFSVIHHIDSADFPAFAKEVARVSKGYLFIKDVDLEHEGYRILYQQQHYLYEGVLLPGTTSYLNSDVSFDKTTKALADAGFEFVRINRQNNFNRGYYALYKITTKPQLKPAFKPVPKVEEVRSNDFRGRTGGYRGDRGGGRGGRGGGYRGRGGRGGGYRHYEHDDRHYNNNNNRNYGGGYYNRDHNNSYDRQDPYDRRGPKRGRREDYYEEDRYERGGRASPTYEDEPRSPKRRTTEEDHRGRKSYSNRY